MAYVGSRDIWGSCWGCFQCSSPRSLVFFHDCLQYLDIWKIILAPSLYSFLNIHIDITLGYELINEIGSMLDETLWRHPRKVCSRKWFGDSICWHSFIWAKLVPALVSGAPVGRANSNVSLDLLLSLKVQQLFCPFRNRCSSTWPKSSLGNLSSQNSPLISVG